jgi:hypothetical protein
MNLKLYSTDHAKGLQAVDPIAIIEESVIIIQAKDS